MQKIINQLIQLQELTIAREQQEASDTSAHLDALNQNIESMVEELPEEIATQFLKLQKRDGLAIVPITEKVCAGCGMSLPVSFVQSVRQAKTIQICPSCARILYFSDRVMRKTPKKRTRYESAQVGIERFSNSGLMIPDVTATDAEGLIHACADLLKTHEYVDQADLLAEEALKREAIASTAVDYGLAFPHVRGVEGGGLSLVTAISRDGINFGNPNGELSHIFFFITIPSAASAFYLKLLSGLTKTFQRKESREKLLDCDTSEKMWKKLMQLTKKTIP